MTIPPLGLYSEENGSEDYFFKWKDVQHLRWDIENFLDCELNIDIGPFKAGDYVQCICIHDSQSICFWTDFELLLEISLTDQVRGLDKWSRE